MAEEVTTDKINEVEMRQIAEELKACFEAGVTSWQVLKTLRRMRLDKTSTRQENDGEDSPQH